MLELSVSRATVTNVSWFCASLNIGLVTKITYGPAILVTVDPKACIIVTNLTHIYLIKPKNCGWIWS